MADILIRMEMPNNVFDCPLNSFGICNLAQDETHCDCIVDSHPEWCPLIPLQEGHGRLIDADALIDALETQDYSCAPDTLEDWTPQDMTVAEIADITHAPTIVPAEGGTDDGN